MLRRSRDDARGSDTAPSATPCDPASRRHSPRRPPHPADASADGDDAPDFAEPRFQPQICGDTGQVISCDVLASARSQPLTGGSLPDAAVGLLRPALRTLRAHDRAGTAPGGVTLRLGAVWLGDPALADLLLWEIDRSELSPARITFGVGEWAALERGHSVVTDNLGRLGAAGCRLELCDFGAGTLSPRRPLADGLHMVRIARAFTHGCADDPQRQHIILAVLALAARMQLDTHADGVSSLLDLSFLMQIGVNRISGTAVSPPLDADGLGGFVRQRQQHMEAAAALKLA